MPITVVAIVLDVLATDWAWRLSSLALFMNWVISATENHQTASQGQGRKRVMIWDLEMRTWPRLLAPVRKWGCHAVELFDWVWSTFISCFSKQSKWGSKGKSWWKIFDIQNLHLTSTILPALWRIEELLMLLGSRFFFCGFYICERWTILYWESIRDSFWHSQRSQPSCHAGNLSGRIPFHRFVYPEICPIA